MFTMANTISVATYTIGFSESLLDFLADVVPNWDGIVVPQSECSSAGCRLVHSLKLCPFSRSIWDALGMLFSLYRTSKSAVD